MISPSHYTKKFHKKYTDMAKIMPFMEQQKMTKAEEWPNFYNKVQAGVLGDAGGWIKHPYPKDIPVLYPWIVKEIKPDTSWVMERNPYFFQVDTAGNQLPYIDQLNRQFIAQSELMNLDIIAGKVDIQGQFLRIDDYPLFKENEAKGNYNAIPVAAWQHHVLIYWLNPPVKDEKWSKALSNVEFRKALSIALDRKQINEAVFKGLGTPAQFAPPKTSPLYDPALTNNAVEYNPKEAAAILDKLGYKDTNGDKVREFPDGGDMVLPLMFYEVTPAAVPGVKMATQYWGDIGIKVDSKLLQGTAFWNFQGANEVPMSVWWANGPDFGDIHFIGLNVSAPLWRRYYNTMGKEGLEPPQWLKRIWEIQDQRVQVATAEERMKLDKEGWKLINEQLVTLGVVEGAKNPLILSKSFGNAEYGFKKSFVGPTYMEGVVQFYHKDPARRK
jgi:peptide/nickel transport system substrate-binding protein